MERKVKWMKLTGIMVLFLSVGIALALSDMPAIPRWICAAAFAAAIVLLWLKRNKMENVDEREMYIEHVAGWLSGILTLIVVNIFIISDVIRYGHFDNRLFALISVWAGSKALVVIFMGGGRGKIS